MANTINLEEFKTLLNYFIDNNIRLVSEGKKPSTIGIEGEAGCGKSAILEQVALERGMTFVKLVLSQLDEIGDLCGFPIKEFKVIEYKDGEEPAIKWVASDVLNTYFQLPCSSYEVTGESRMSYAPPAWLPKEENPNGIMLCLDDYSRASSQFMQCVMELIDRGSYMTWKLPKNTFICTSSNPDNGMYSVSALDSAQKTRLINFNVEFSTDVWAKWAENANLDNRAINFALYYAEQLFKNDGVVAVNARSYTAFCNAISGLKDWDKSESLAMILNISKGCFDDTDNRVGKLFTTFINMKLDKLMDPKKMLSGKWETIQSELKDCVYTSDGRYRAEIAAVLSTRLTNYIMKLFATPGAVKNDEVCTRILNFVEDAENKNTRIFSEDILFNICKQLVSKYSSRTTKLLMNAKVRKKLM